MIIRVDLNRTTLSAGASHACNHLGVALRTLGHITLDLADRKWADDELAKLALANVRTARSAIVNASRTMRHTERHLSACIGRELVPSQVEQIRAIVQEARYSDLEARTRIMAVLDDRYTAESED